MKRITFTASAGRDFLRLPKATQAQVREKLARYAHAGAGDVKKLTGRGGARLRVGAYRVIFTETEAEITVAAIGHRREVYR